MKSSYEEDLKTVHFILGKRWVCRLCHKESEAPEVINGHDTHIIETGSSTYSVTLFDILRRITNLPIETEELACEFCSECCQQLLSHYLFGLYCLEQEKRLHDLINSLSHHKLDCIDIKNEPDVDERNLYLFAFNPLEESTKEKSRKRQRNDNLDENHHIVCKKKNKNVLHDSNAKFTCDLCNSTFYSKRNLHKHMNTVHVTCPGACEICGKVFKTITLLKSHLITHSDYRNHKCRYCDNSFKTRNALVYHERTHSGERPYPCSQCDLRFLSASTRKYHFLGKHCEKTVSCNICLKKYSSLRHVRQHMSRVHFKIPKESKINAPTQLEIELKPILRNEKSMETNLIKSKDNTVSICESCGKILARDTLRHHRIICKKKDKSVLHDQNVKLTCDQCNLTFNFKRNLYKHMRNVHVACTVACEICGKLFKTVTQLKSHLITHSDNRKHKCRYCPNRFKTRHTMIYHERIHSGEKPYSCSKCDMSFLSASRRQAHFLSKHCEKSVTCNICLKKFSSNIRVRQHIKNVHFKVPKESTISATIQGDSELKPIVGNEKSTKTKTKKQSNRNKMGACDFCGRILASKVTLHHHRIVCKKRDKTVLPDPDSKFICDLCSYTFYSKGHLKNHIKNVHFACSVPCEICGKLFKTVTQLKNHLIVHSDERNLQCRFCEKSFKSTNALVYHERIHTGETPYPCSKCDLSFLSASRRNYHFLAKHCEKDAECSICLKKFSSNNNVRQHMKKVHFKGMKNSESGAPTQGVENKKIKIKPFIKIKSKIK